MKEAQSSLLLPDIRIIEGDGVCEESDRPGLVLLQLEGDSDGLGHLLVPVPGLQEESHTEVLLSVHGDVVVRLQGDIPAQTRGGQEGGDQH